MKESLKGRGWDKAGLVVNGTNDFNQTRSRCVAPGGIDWTGTVLKIDNTLASMIRNGTVSGTADNDRNVKNGRRSLTILEN